jgi:peptide/nickel transport system substrate-binding protein
MRKLLSLVLLIIFFSCGEKKDLSDLSIFKYNESAGINSLDPAFSKDQASVWAVSQLFNGLVQLDSNLNINTCIAKSWVISSNSLVYKFNLRDDVYFHDHKNFKDSKGRKVTAYDFEFSFSRILDNDIASPGRWVFTNVDSFKAVNDSSFIIILKKPFPGFLGLLTMQYCSVVPKEITSSIDFHANPIGTGPFKFQLWEQGEKLVFRRNPNYFESFNGASLPFLDGVAITFLRDKQAAFLQFIMGNTDFLSGIDASYKDEILTKEGSLKPKYHNKINYEIQNYLNTEYLGFLFSDTISATKHLKIRKAINYGFDRKKMLRYLRNNIGTPAENGFVPKGMPSFNSKLIGYNYNPEKSLELIKQVKTEYGADLGQIKLSTTSSYLDLCEYIQNELAKLGLEISIDVNPPSTHRQMVATSKLSFFRGSWIADYPDAENYLSLFYSKNFSPNGPNYTHFNNLTFDSLYDISLSEVNDSIRYQYYNLMDQIIIDNAQIVPLYYDNVLRFTQKNINGLASNSINMLNLKYVDKILFK